jgi:carbon-monoxide dehydrogenase large subunit
MNNGIGQPVRRLEDARLLTGRGIYADDVNVPGQARAVFVRSPHAHAKILKIDIEAARRMPGVLMVLTAQHWKAAGLQGIPHGANPIDLLDVTIPALTDRRNQPHFMCDNLPFCSERARYVGDVVACVIAETMAEARSAAEAVEVEYDPLPSVVESEDAIEPDAPQLWDGAPGNVAFDVEKGNWAAADAAIASAEHVVRARIRSPRVQVVPMETKGAVAHFDKDGRLIFEGATQGAPFYKMMFARIFGIEQDKIRVITKDVGGAFGIKQNICPEHVAIILAARELKRPVKWMADRAEAFAADYQGRDFTTEATLALDKDGRFLALKADHLYNLGAYTVSYVPMANGWRVSAGCYKYDAVAYRARAVLTNVAPTAPYRGAGRPESLFVLERIIDIAAAECGFDRIELRRKNLVRPEDLPMTNGAELPFKTDIDFPANMEAALEAADWDGFAERVVGSQLRGKLRGIGLANYVETPTGAPIERADVTVDPKGEVRIAIGVGPSGQGSETVIVQVLADRLGLPLDKVKIVLGDTDIVKEGGGSHSVRAMRLGGTVTVGAAKKIVEQGTQLASQALEAAPGDIEYGNGEFRVKGTDKTISLFNVAKIAPLEASDRVSQRMPAYPCGTAICELEIDPESGAVEIVDYVTVDDVGRTINPLLVDGQVKGGIAMGIGQALMERAAYDRESGQLLSGSLMDYALPRADNTLAYRTALRDMIAEGNPLGVKGAGESGSTPAPSAIINAVVHALRDHRITHLDMPATAERIWRAIQWGGAKTIPKSMP